MEFNRGMVGVLVVVLSLIASIGLGVITNINSETVPKDVEIYIADITGAFDSQKDQSYVTINPASNFNGYTTDTPDRFPVDFERSDYTNNYPIKYTAETYNQTFTGDVGDIASELSITPNNALSYTGYYKKDILTSSRTYSQLDQKLGMYVTIQGLQTTTVQTPVIEFSDLIPKLREIADAHGPNPTTNKITIPVEVTDTRYMMIYDDEYGMDATSGPWYFTDNYLVMHKRGTDSNLVYTQDVLNNVGEDNTFAIEYVYSISSGKGTWSVNGTLLANAEPSQFYLIGPAANNAPRIYTTTMKNTVQISTNTNIDSSTDTTWISSPEYTNKMEITVSYGETTRFLDTRYGVSIPNTGVATWSNGQANGITDIVFSATDSSDCSNTGVLNIKSGQTVNTDTINISKISGSAYISINGGTPLNIGAWSQFLLRINTLTGSLTVIPISEWSNFNTYTLSNFIIDGGVIPHTGDLISIDWTANNSFSLQVVNTEVFLNTYGVVMIDPSITISTLWPNYSRFLIELNKVATVGTSVTIGSTTFTLDGNLIRIQDANLNEKIFDITNLKLYYNKVTENNITYWNITMESGDTTYTFSESTTYLGFTGKWYFNTGFYKVETQNVQEIQWNPFYIPNMTFIFLFMAIAILIMGTIAYKKGYLDGLSMIIIITTEIILVLIIGGN